MLHLSRGTQSYLVGLNMKLLLNALIHLWLHCLLQAASCVRSKDLAAIEYFLMWGVSHVHKTKSSSTAPVERLAKFLQ